MATSIINVYLLPLSVTVSDLSNALKAPPVSEFPSAGGEGYTPDPFIPSRWSNNGTYWVTQLNTNTNYWIYFIEVAGYAPQQFTISGTSDVYLTLSTWAVGTRLYAWTKPNASNYLGTICFTLSSLPTIGDMVLNSTYNISANAVDSPISSSSIRVANWNGDILDLGEYSRDSTLDVIWDGTEFVAASEVDKPEVLYAWTDSSSSSNAKTLYAWYNDFDGPGAPSDTDRVIYTTTPNPTINSTLYDSNMNIITLGDGISSASDSAITIQYLPSDD